jgi:hypothetical protein
MGSDFIFAALRWPSDADGAPLTAGPALVSETLRRLTEAFTCEVDLGNFGYYLEDEVSEEERREIFEQAADFVRSLFSSDEWPRDIGYAEFGPHCNVLLTGGMSYGDEPTESYRIMALLDGLGITREPYSRAAIAAFDEAVTARGDESAAAEER